MLYGLKTLVGTEEELGVVKIKKKKKLSFSVAGTRMNRIRNEDMRGNRAYLMCWRPKPMRGRLRSSGGRRDSEDVCCRMQRLGEHRRDLWMCK